MEKTEKELNVLGIDLDKTIAHNSPHPDYALLEPIQGAKETLRRLYLEGWEIVIYTARPWHDYDMIRDWLDKYEIEYSRIVCGKLFCKYLIDDRAIQFKSWEQAAKEII